ncbi:MAG: hypothetical protein JSW70_07735 [Syntrophobacterales bacterium]|nr:MAG: hypothetical protein JSW70_07735 [Syntrophobacterales bacterium]
MRKKREDKIIEAYIEEKVKPVLKKEFLNLSHTFSLLGKEPNYAFQSLFILTFMAPLLMGKREICKRNLIMLKGLVDRLEALSGKSRNTRIIIDAFYEEFDSVILKLNKIHQLYDIEMDLSLLKDVPIKMLFGRELGN